MPIAVSVIIPTYNCSRYVRGAVESALQQTHEVAEVIVVDDGSTDDTALQAMELEALKPGVVRYVTRQNGGVSAARMTGVEATSSQWVALLDADDRWHSRKLALQLQAVADTPGAGWSLSGCEVIDGNDRTMDERDPFLATFSIFGQLGQTPAQFFESWLTKRGALDAGDRSIPLYTGDLFEPLFLGNVCLPSSALIRRDALVQAGGFNPALRLAEETEFFHRLAARSQVAYLAGPLVQYRKGQAGALTSGSNTVPLTRNALESMNAAVDYRGGLTQREQQTFRRGRANLLLYMARAQLAEHDAGGARNTLRELRRDGVAPAARLAPLIAASLLPESALRALLAARRALRA